MWAVAAPVAASGDERLYGAVTVTLPCRWVAPKDHPRRRGATAFVVATDADFRDPIRTPWLEGDGRV